MITIDKDKDENQPLNKKARSLADIAKWGKITAVFLIITGSLSALSAIVTLLGAIPGVLLIISGVMLMRSAKAAAALQEGLEENAEENMLAHYASFIKMQFLRGIQCGTGHSRFYFSRHLRCHRNYGLLQH